MTCPDGLITSPVTGTLRWLSTIGEMKKSWRKQTETDGESVGHIFDWWW